MNRRSELYLSAEVFMLINQRTVRIEWGDCDPGGIVYFPRYFECFDACTRALFERAGLSKREMMKSYAMNGIPLVDIKARFLMPSRFGDDVVVESSVATWGNTSFVVQHRLMKGEALAVECFETRVWVAHPGGDPEKFEARPIPEEVKARFGGAQSAESNRNSRVESTSE
ncbi:MAG TPA: thioesterase family protein [Terriglobales bacterium]|nr:thioesterase family protein [Terriglobales bacterium]